MRTSPGPTLLCGVLIAACLPAVPPEWVAQEPHAWGIAIRVVEDGDYGDLLTVPPDRTRADVLPFDVVELQWYGAGPEGSATDPPIWVAYAQSGYFDLLQLSDGALPDCPDPLPFSPPLCRLDVGERVRVQLDSSAQLRPELRLGFQPLQFIAVASDAEVTDPESCLKLLLSERNPDLTGCLLALRTVAVGPSGLLWSLFGPPAAYAGISLAELRSEPPNLNPVIERLELTRVSEHGESTSLVQDGDRVTVTRGESLALRVRLGADAVQDYPDYGLNGGLERGVEDLDVVGRFSAWADDYEVSDDELEHRWTAVATTHFYLQVGDDRGGRAFVTLRFVVDEDP